MPRNFWENPLDRQFFRELGETRELQKLEKIIKEIAEKTKNEGIPVTEDCRIDMDAFCKKDSLVYSQEVVENDKKIIRELEEKWHQGSREQEIKERKLRKLGSQLEMLKTIIFYKFLKEKFIVTRTSSFDDIKNKADNIILERESGNVVCAFDEVGDDAGGRYEEKRMKVLERNVEKNGVNLKYGIKAKFEKEKLKFELGALKNIPIFYLALFPDSVKEGIKKLAPEINEASEYEKKLFQYFISSLKSQIDALRLKPNLDKTLAAKINHFEESLKTL